MHGRTDNVKTVYPLQTKFAGGIKQLIDIVIIHGNYHNLCKLYPQEPVDPLALRKVKTP